MGLLSGLWNAATWAWNQLQNVAPGFTEAVTNTVTNIIDTVVDTVQNTGSQSNTPAQPRPPTTPTGPTPEEIRQQRINQRANQFDRDIGRLMRPDLGEDARFYDEYPSDRILNSPASMADMILLAGQNPVVYGLMQMMRHERQTLAAFMQHPVRPTADTLRLLFADAVHYEHFTDEAAKWWDRYVGGSSTSWRPGMSSVGFDLVVSNSPWVSPGQDEGTVLEGDELASLLADMESRFGVTITTDQVPLTQEAYTEFFNSLVSTGDFLAQLHCGTNEDCLDAINRDAIVRLFNVDIIRVSDPLASELVQQNINPLIRTCVEWNENGECQKIEYRVGRGYTSGSTIYDIWGPTRYDSDLKVIPGHDRTEVMIADNFTHELAGHVYQALSGLENFWSSPILRIMAMRSDTSTSNNRRTIGDDVRDLMAELGLLNPSVIGPGTRQNRSPEPHEVAADLALFSQLGMITDYDNTILAPGLRQFLLHRTSPEDLYAEYVESVENWSNINSNPIQKEIDSNDPTYSYLPMTGLVNRATWLPRDGNPNNTAEENKDWSSGYVFGNLETGASIPAGTTVTVIGRLEEPTTVFNSNIGYSYPFQNYWIYVGWSVGNEEYRYGWIQNPGIENIEEIPVLSFDDVNPQREYDYNDEYNPPDDMFFDG